VAISSENCAAGGRRRFAQLGEPLAQASPSLAADIGDLEHLDFEELGQLALGRLREGALEDRHGGGSTAAVLHCAGELERGHATCVRVRGQLDRALEVLGGARHPGAPGGPAELEQQLGSLRLGRCLGQRALEIGGGRRGHAQRDGARARLAENRHDRGIAGGLRSQQVGGDLLHRGSPLHQQGRRPAVGATLRRVAHALAHRRADHLVHKGEPLGMLEHARPQEGVGGGLGIRLRQACELGGEGNREAVPEDGDRFGERARPGWQSVHPQEHDIGHAPGGELGDNARSLF
jgi:hypothetical protein